MELEPSTLLIIVSNSDKTIIISRFSFHYNRNISWETRDQLVYKNSQRSTGRICQNAYFVMQPEIIYLAISCQWSLSIPPENPRKRSMELITSSKFWKGHTSIYTPVISALPFVRSATSFSAFNNQSLICTRSFCNCCRFISSPSKISFTFKKVIVI